MGVAVMVSVSTFTFSWRNFSFVETPNFCSSSMMSSPRSLNFTSLPTMRWVPIRMFTSPAASAFSVLRISVAVRARLM